MSRKVRLARTRTGDLSQALSSHVAAHISLTRYGKKRHVGSQAAWKDVAFSARRGLRQACGWTRDGENFYQDILNDAPFDAGRTRGGLPCVAFSHTGVVSCSQSFMDLSGQSFEAMAGLDLRKVHLHSLLPEQLNKKLNIEAWSALQKLHTRTFEDIQAMRSSASAIETALSRAKLLHQESIEAGSCTMTHALLVSPCTDGVFWNVVQAFAAVHDGDLMVVHVLMPLKAPVAPLMWLPRATPESVPPGPAPEVLPLLETILLRVRSSLVPLAEAEAAHMCSIMGALQLMDDGVDIAEDEASPRRRSPQPIISRPSWHQLHLRFTDQHAEKEDASEGCFDGMPALLKAAESGCTWLARALAMDAYDGNSWVPRLGSASAISFQDLSRWESVFSKELEGRTKDWKLEDAGHQSQSQSSQKAFLIVEPSEVDCPLAFISPGFEEMTGRRRAFALGRNLRFLQLQDIARNRAFNGTELARIDDFCQSQTCEGHLVSLLLLSTSTGKVFWSLLYLQHAFMEDPDAPGIRHDYAQKHMVLGALVPMTTQQEVLDEALTWDCAEVSMHLLARLRALILEKSQQPFITERSLQSLADEAVPEWLLENGRQVKTCMAGYHFVPRVGLAPVRDFGSRWAELFERSAEFLRRGLQDGDDSKEELLDMTAKNAPKGMPCVVMDPRAKDCPIVFASQSMLMLTGHSSDYALARNLRYLQPRSARIDAALNGEEPLRIKEFCSSVRDHGDSLISLLLCERKSGERFWGLMLTLHVEGWEKRPMLLAAVIEIDVKMPGVLKSHKISELVEDDSGLVIDAWSLFIGSFREELELVVTESGKNVDQACRFVAKGLLVFMRTGEDYEGDHFVPRTGLVEAHRFQESRALKHVLAAVQEDARRLLELQGDFSGEDSNVSFCIADPEGEDCPLVYISPGFESLTGYQHEWALGRNCRFLQPKSSARNLQFNSDQLDKLRSFCQVGRSERVAPTAMFFLLINETRLGYPFWNLSCYLRTEVLGRLYIVSVTIPIQEERLRLAELLCLDVEGTRQLERLKGMLSRHQGSTKFTSLPVLCQQLIDGWLPGYSSVLQVPTPSNAGFRAPGGLEQQISLFGLELQGAGNMEAMLEALKSGVRHLHIALPNNAQSKAADGMNFAQRLIPLKLAEVMNMIHKQNLHYLREATVITMRSPPHVLPVLNEVRKTLATHGYSVACMLLDVRGCNAAEVAEHWHTISQEALANGEVLGLFGGGPRLLSAALGVRGGAPVSIYATDMHPGRRQDEPEVRLFSKLRGMGILPMACNVFGPQESWISSPIVKAAAARLNTEPALLALKWAEHKGFAAVAPHAPQLLRPQQEHSGTSCHGDPTRHPPDDVHRSFVRQYLAAPSAEACAAVVADLQATGPKKRRIGVTRAESRAVSPCSTRGPTPIPEAGSRSTTPISMTTRSPTPGVDGPLPPTYWRAASPVQMPATLRPANRSPSPMSRPSVEKWGVRAPVETPEMWPDEARQESEVLASATGLEHSQHGLKKDLSSISVRARMPPQNFGVLCVDFGYQEDSIDADCDSGTAPEDVFIKELDLQPEFSSLRAESERRSSFASGAGAAAARAARGGGRELLLFPGRRISGSPRRGRALWPAPPCAEPPATARPVSRTLLRAPDPFASEQQPKARQRPAPVAQRGFDSLFTSLGC